MGAHKYAHPLSSFLKHKTYCMWMSYNQGKTKQESIKKPPKGTIGRSKQAMDKPSRIWKISVWVTNFQSVLNVY